MIGTVRKGDAERDPSLIHREIAILIHRNGGRELLWQLRSAAKNVMPLTWDFACAGHVERGRSAARRGAPSTCSRSLASTRTWSSSSTRLVRQPWETYFVSVFAGPMPAGVQPRLDPDEVAAVEWCDAAGLRRWVADDRPLSPIARELAEAFWAAAPR